MFWAVGCAVGAPGVVVEVVEGVVDAAGASEALFVKMMLCAHLTKHGSTDRPIRDASVWCALLL